MNTVYVLKRIYTDVEEFVQVGADKNELAAKAVKELLTQKKEIVLVTLANPKTNQITKDDVIYISGDNHLEYVISVHKV